MFDGDILNIIAIADSEIIYMFRKFNPVTRMIIARDTGLLNSYFSVKKEQLTDLYYFATCGAAECDTPEIELPESEYFKKQEWEEEVILDQTEPSLRLYMENDEFIKIETPEEVATRKGFKIIAYPEDGDLHLEKS